MNIPDSEVATTILTRLKEGDLIAFKELFVKFQPKLYAFVFRYLKGKEDSEEIVQEVFIQVWENRSNINENLSFKSFLFTITKNKITDYFRKKKTEILYRNYVLNYLEVLHDNTNKELIYKDYTALLADTIDQLPEKRKIIFIMSKKLGMSRNEIAQFLNISENTVKNQLQEAMKFLRNIFDKEIWPVALLLISLISIISGN
jgi:RNA polymerase sigma-70 factor (ECF subfamily)